MSPSALNKDVGAYLDDPKNIERFINRLRDAVKIDSISGEPARRQRVIDMGEWLNQRLTDLGVTTELRDLGYEAGVFVDNVPVKLPPVILGRIGDDKNKKTVLIYGHYDVQPAAKEDGWITEPFELDVKADHKPGEKYDAEKRYGQMIGRGSSDDKGPILGWLNVLEAHNPTPQKPDEAKPKADPEWPTIPLPVNLRFCFEGMEESGSEGLDALIQKEANQEVGWFKGVDCVCISDNYWLGTTTPALTYGLRGLAYFKITVSGPARDLHSGVFGRAVHEPMTDLISLMSRLVDPAGNILVPGVDNVGPASTDELDIYEKLDYGLEDIKAAVGANIALSADRVQVMMGRMRMPSLSLHGIEGAFSGPGAKTVIPASVSGKFSIRLVPEQIKKQTPEEIAAKKPAEKLVDTVTALVTAYLESEFAKLGSKNRLTIEMLHGGEPWLEDPKHWSYAAAKKATEDEYGRPPDLTREGGSIPVTLTFAQSLEKNVLLLPMGRGDDGAHSTNEKLDKTNFVKGTKLFARYLYEIAEPNVGN
ncbi:CNDP dipeptidase [Mycena maculata]|uniref:CNDP dipeptidase n=1 Tax=Mycena maculata TaxID=230809 RepID=A0AAD7KK18_9AGAR|nr:CNDP dipeptidase [Mycena maculata]